MTAGRLGIVLAATLAVAGCGSDGPIDALSSLNPLKKEEQLVPGNRQAVLPGGGMAVVSGKMALIGLATALGDWSQPGGNAANNPGNIAGMVSGAKSWSASSGSASGGGMLSFSSGKPIRVSAKPVSTGGSAFVYDPTGGVVALSLANGGRLWSVNLRPEGESAAVNGGGVAASAGRVVAATGFAEVVGLDAATGARAWTLKIDAPVRGAPTIAGGKAFVTTQAGTIVAVDIATGAKLWGSTSGGSGAGLLSASSPAVAGNIVVVPTGSGEIKALDIASGEVKWGASVAGGSRTSAITGLNDASASPVIDGDIVYATGVGGSTIAVSLKSGEQIWGQPIGGPDTPVLSGNALFVLDLDERLIALDKKTGSVIWSATLPGADLKKSKRAGWNGPVMVGGKLWVVSEDGRVLAVDASSGAAGVPANIGIAASIPPVFAGGNLLVLGGDGTLVALN